MVVVRAAFGSVLPPAVRRKLRRRVRLAAQWPPPLRLRRLLRKLLLRVVRLTLLLLLESNEPQIWNK